MHISIVTLFPELYESFCGTSLVGRAREAGHVSIELKSLLSYVAPKVRVDAPSFGHGAGMLLKPEIIEKAVVEREAAHGKALKIFFSPHGKKLTQQTVQVLTQRMQEAGHVLLLPARYEGMDARVEAEYADEIISIGDYVLMGGDIPAMVFLEATLRHVPGVVGRQESVTHDSFSGPFVDYPEYTEPVTWHEKTVPEVVRSGNHAALATWRSHEAARRTMLGHFDWFRERVSTPQDIALGRSQVPPHYVVLMHSEVLVPARAVAPEGMKPQDMAADAVAPGNTSVTSIDIHDIARSATTYGFEGYFLVTPLQDQQTIVRELLKFWTQGTGATYNRHRHAAISRVQLVSVLDEVLGAIEQKHGQKPVLVATSAQENSHAKTITYHDQAQVWSQNRPVLFVLGTGHGLAPSLLERCDYQLVPIKGMTDFNHLSVRSAAAVIFDRWLGLNIASE